MTVQELTPQLRQMQRVKTGVEGLLVVRVKEVSPAADAQIQEGDVITSVNGEKVTTTDEFGKIVGEGEEGRLPEALHLQPARRRLALRARQDRGVSRAPARLEAESPQRPLRRALSFPENPRE